MQRILLLRILFSNFYHIPANVMLKQAGWFCHFTFICQEVEAVSLLSFQNNELNYVKFTLFFINYPIWKSIHAEFKISICVKMNGYFDTNVNLKFCKCKSLSTLQIHLLCKQCIVSYFVCITVQFVKL